MVTIRVLKFESNDPSKFVEIRAYLEPHEFKLLHGNYDHLGIFTNELITEYASIIKTGANHSCAKYFLYPSTLRKQFQTGTYDFSRLRCGTFEYPNSIYIIYHVPQKGIGR